MKKRIRTQTRIAVVALAFAVAALVGPGAAGAATIVNGDFETGNLSGWQVLDLGAGEGEIEGTENTWYAYSGTTLPGSSTLDVIAPPGGQFAAATSQGGPGLHVLYQDIALEPYFTHRLWLLAYYHSEAPLTTPSPPTFAFDGEPANQQYRIDVLRSTAAPDSLDPADILATVFATETGGPEQLGPTLLSVDLSPFAGQAVRLRFAEVDNESFFAASVDNVAIVSTPPSNGFTFGKPIFKPKKGTAKLPVTALGAGTLVIADVKKTKKRVKTKTFQLAGAGALRLPVQPTKRTRKVLKARGVKKLKVAVTFTPIGGLPATQTRKLGLRLKR